MPFSTVSFIVRIILLGQLNNDIEVAKTVELENWTREKVYEEVHNLGQNFNSVRWVIPKLIDGKLKSKAELVARGFEEDSSKL